MCSYDVSIPYYYPSAEINRLRQVACVRPSVIQHISNQAELLREISYSPISNPSPDFLYDIFRSAFLLFSFSRIAAYDLTIFQSTL